MGLSACAPSASGATDENQADEPKQGTLYINQRTELEGTHYALDAIFDVTGPERFTIDLAYTTMPISRALKAGPYSITIRPGYRVLQDVAVAEVPVQSELVSDATQTFQISAEVTTQVVYRFALGAGTVAFDKGK